MLQKERLPSTRAFYEGAFGRLPRSSSRGECAVRCCFHSESNASMHVDVRGKGKFFCFGCGAKGGDIIDFIKLRDGVDFKTAVQSLGAWSIERLSADDRRQQAKYFREREQQRKEAEQLAKRLHRAAAYYQGRIRDLQESQRLAGLALEDPSTSPEDREFWWANLSELLEPLREALCAYFLLAFGAKAECEEFINNQSWRNTAISQVMVCGVVRDDRGRVTEVPLP